MINPHGTTIEERINPPQGFERVSVDSTSFGYYLRHLKLKPASSPVKYYNGALKNKPHVYIAVVDMHIGTSNLQQCADAVIRLRAEYLYQQKRYAEIAFNFTSGFKADYLNWLNKKRISVKGNDVKRIQTNKTSDTYNSFRQYLDVVFTYAGTLSLSKELKTKDLKDIQIGDVFIQGGSPGHAVIVVDMVTDTLTGDKAFLLAQSYMPAQDIQILKNPSKEDDNPWYSLNDIKDVLVTPEWTFNNRDLKKF